MGALRHAARVVGALVRALLERLRPRARAARVAALQASLPRVASDAEAASTLRAATRCVGCGACDAAFDGWDRVDCRLFRAPSELPRAYATGLDVRDAMHGWLAQLRRGELERLSAACPVGVSFVSLARVVEARAGAPRSAPRVAAVRRVRHDPG